jgi:hypothetical protein
MLTSLTDNLALESTLLKNEHCPLLGIIAGILQGEKLDAGTSIEPYEGSIRKLQFQGRTFSVDSIPWKNRRIHRRYDPILLPLSLHSRRPFQGPDSSRNTGLNVGGLEIVC